MPAQKFLSSSELAKSLVDMGSSRSLPISLPVAADRRVQRRTKGGDVLASDRPKPMND